jgi:hypothetical protein
LGDGAALVSDQVAATRRHRAAVRAQPVHSRLPRTQGGGQRNGIGRVAASQRTTQKPGPGRWSGLANGSAE